MKNKLKLISVIFLILSLLVIPLNSHAAFAGNPDHRSDASIPVGIFGLPFVIALIIILNVIAKKIEFIRCKPKSAPKDINNIQDYKKTDPSFSEEEFSKKVADMYLDFQKCWQEKDISSLRSCMTDDLYAHINRLLNNYRMKNQTNHIDDIVILGVELTGWRKEGGNIEMIAHIHTSIFDYVTNDKKRKLIRGSMNEKRTVCYEWTFVRPDTPNPKTDPEPICPNCGKKLDTNNSSVCRYCKTHITFQDSDWALNDIKDLSKTFGR